MNAKQNAYVEKLAKDAAAGKGYDWKKTPIEETPVARATDLFRRGGFFNDDWWHKAEPTYHDGTKVIQDVKGMKIVDKIVTKYAHDRAMAPVAASWEKSMPGPNVDLRHWLNTHFVVRVNTNRTPYGSLLRSYIEKSKLGSRLGDVNEHTIRTLVQAICEGGNS